MTKLPILLLISFALAIGILIIAVLKTGKTEPGKPPAKADEVITTYIFSNGSDYTKSHGKHTPTKVTAAVRKGSASSSSNASITPP